MTAKRLKASFGGSYYRVGQSLTDCPALHEENLITEGGVIETEETVEIGRLIPVSASNGLTPLLILVQRGEEKKQLVLGSAATADLRLEAPGVGPLPGYSQNTSYTTLTYSHFDRSGTLCDICRAERRREGSCPVRRHSQHQ